MGETFQDLLDRFIEARDGAYHKGADCDGVRLNNVESVVQTMLEMLRDKFEQ